MKPLDILCRSAFSSNTGMINSLRKLSRDICGVPFNTLEPRDTKTPTNSSRIITPLNVVRVHMYYVLHWKPKTQIWTINLIK